MKEVIIIRHRKENLKKCSLRGLEGRKDIKFYTYPSFLPESLDGYFVLDVEGEEMKKDGAPFVLIDGTWRYADVMMHTIPSLKGLQRYKIPEGWKTAYPRKQTLCPDPERGLASIEALYIAYLLTGRPTEGLLDGYYWKEDFLERNKELISNALIV